MCDILEVAESCMQELARMQDLTLVDSAPDRLGDSDGEDAGPKGEDRHIKQIDAEEKKIEAQLALLSPVTKRTLTIEDQGLLKKCMMRWMSKPWNNMLATAFMEIRRARLSLQQISRAQMQELQSMVNPPKLVKLALEALCTLLYGWSHSKWEGIRKILHHEDFGPSLMKYRGQNLTPELVEWTGPEVHRQPAVHGSDHRPGEQGVRPPGAPDPVARGVPQAHHAIRGERAAGERAQHAAGPAGPGALRGNGLPRIRNHLIHDASSSSRCTSLSTRGKKCPRAGPTTDLRYVPNC